MKSPVSEKDQTRRDSRPFGKLRAGSPLSSQATSRTFFLAVVIFAVALPVLAQGGPPFITDDPGTPGDGNWEINVAAYAERHPTERVFDLPILDLNYGWGPRIQLNYQVPYLVDGTDGGPTRSGLGKSLIGVKWRFYDSGSGEDGLQISTYPHLEVNNPTSSVERGLVDAGTRLYLPIQLTKKVGPFVIDPEVGYWFADRAGQAWATGIVVGRDVNKRLELDGELYATANTNGSNHWTTYDAGGRYKLGEQFIMLFMAGRSFRGSGQQADQPQFFGYLGMQFLFSIKHKKDASPETHP